MSLRDFVIYKAGRLIPDRIWIQIKFRQWMGHFCNLKHPKTYNEKLQWIKLNDRRPEYTTMVDKYASKQYAAGRIGDQYIVPCVGGPWKHFDEIDFDSLPERFVLKTTHDCGGVVICRDKASFDKASARALLERQLQHDYYLTNREWPYKNVERRIFAEEYLQDGESGQLADYKLFCFNGKARLVLVCRDRYSESGLTEDFFTPDWEHLPMARPNHPNAKNPIPRPETLAEMLHRAEILSANCPFLRVDFYEIEGKPLLGELTLFPASGNVPFEPESWDEVLGEWLTLPERKN